MAVNALSHALHQSFHRICRNSTRGSSRKNADEISLLRFRAYLLICFISGHICVFDWGAHLFAHFVSEHTFGLPHFAAHLCRLLHIGAHLFVYFISEHTFWFTSFRSSFVCLISEHTFLCQFQNTLCCLLRFGANLFHCLNFQSKRFEERFTDGFSNGSTVFSPVTVLRLCLPDRRLTRHICSSS